MHKETFYTTKEIKECTIALISDIHYHDKFKQKTLDKLLNQIKSNTPNYIVIAGDILDSSDTLNLEKLEKFLKSLTNIAPTFVIEGNHDEKKGSMKNWTNYKNNAFLTMLNNIPNLHYLNDNSYTIDNITFYGFTLPYTHFEIEKESYDSFCNEMKNIHPTLSDKTYNITLVHSPINIYPFLKNNPEHNLNKSDLILSGHMHNGCLPFILSHPINRIFKTSRGILSPNKTLFPKYAQGRIYERDGYVYEGVTKVSHSTKTLHLLDPLFQKKVEFLIIKKK